MDRIETTLKSLQESLDQLQQDSLYSSGELLFTSSSRDKVAVDIITQNLREFSRITSEEGYNLILRCNDNDEISVILVQSSGFCDPELVLKMMNKLLDTKRRTLILEENKGISVDDKVLETKIKELIAEQVTEIKKEFDEKLKSLMKKQETESSQAKLALEKMIKTRIRHDKQREKTFLEQNSLQFIENSADLRERIKSRLITLNKVLYESSQYRWRNVDIIRKFLLFIQSDSLMHDQVGAVDDIMEWITNDLDRFAYQPREEEKKYFKEEMADKFNLQDVVGTVHFIEMDYNHWKIAGSPSTLVILGLLIINKRVVCTTFCDSHVAACLEFTRIMKLKEWAKDVKVAVRSEVCVRCPFAVAWPFVHCTTQEVYAENEKVVTWMKNCFNLAKSSGNRRNVEFLPFVYNFLLASFL